MSRLIDADALLAVLGINDLDCIKCDWYGGFGCGCVKGSDFRDACVAIENAPTVDAVEVVRCRDCRFYDPPHIEYNDGTRKDVDETGPWVTYDVGTNYGGTCLGHKTYCTAHDRENPDDEENIVVFRLTTDYCSYGERSEE